MGVGLPVPSEDWGQDGGQAGLLINPAIGARFGGSKGVNFTLDAGYRIQKVGYRYESQWEDRLEKHTFKRFSFRAGLLF